MKSEPISQDEIRDTGRAAQFLWYVSAFGIGIGGFVLFVVGRMLHHLAMFLVGM